MSFFHLYNIPYTLLLGDGILYGVQKIFIEVEKYEVQINSLIIRIVALSGTSHFILKCDQSRKVISFLFSEGCSIKQNLKICVKSGIFTLSFWRGFIFVRYSHQRNAGPKTRTSLLWGAFLFCLRFSIGFIFVQHRQQCDAASNSRISLLCGSRIFLPPLLPGSFSFGQSTSMTLDPSRDYHCCGDRVFLPAFSIGRIFVR